MLAYLGDEGNHEVQTWLSPAIEHGTSTLVHTDVSSVNDMECACEVECEDS